MRLSRVITKTVSLHQGWNNSMLAHSLTSAPASTAGRGRLEEFAELSGEYTYTGCPKKSGPMF